MTSASCWNIQHGRSVFTQRSENDYLIHKRNLKDGWLTSSIPRLSHTNAPGLAVGLTYKLIASVFYNLWNQTQQSTIFLQNPPPPPPFFARLNAVIMAAFICYGS